MSEDVTRKPGKDDLLRVRRVLEVPVLQVLPGLQVLKVLVLQVLQVLRVLRVGVAGAAETREWAGRRRPVEKSGAARRRRRVARPFSAGQRPTASIAT